MHTTHLVVETREIAPVEDLLAYADPAHPLAWLRRGDGIVAVGEPLAEVRQPSAAGLSRTAALANAWRGMVAQAEISDPVDLPGSGLVAFGAFAFDEESAADSVLVVPSQVLGRHGDRFWETRIRLAASPVSEEPFATQPYGPHWAGTVGPGAQSPQGYQDSVRRALTRIADGELSKVVLARDLTGSVPAGSDLRRLVRALSTGYPDTWAFAVDGLIGASPETLVT
ncbi:chorismate-binding protein, partial [Microbacterium sp. AGC62]